MSLDDWIYLGLNADFMQNGLRGEGILLSVDVIDAFRNKMFTIVILLEM